MHRRAQQRAIGYDYCTTATPTTHHVLLCPQLRHVLSFSQHISRTNTHTASSYFHLPIDEDEELPAEDHPPYTKHLPWISPDTTDSDDSDASSSSPSGSSTPTQTQRPLPPHSPPPPKRSKAVINEILAQNDCYAVLGISRAARIDKSSLRRAYLARSKACHPEYAPSMHHVSRSLSL